VCVCSCLGSGALWWNSITDPCLSGTFPRFLFAAVLGTCSFFFSFFFFVFFYFDVVPSSPGDTELHSIRKRWTWTQKVTFGCNFPDWTVLLFYLVSNVLYLILLLGRPSATSIPVGLSVDGTPTTFAFPTAKLSYFPVA
jgi:hypothetical protein